MGASLLAIAADQPPLMSADTPLSRAGSLPHGVCVLLTGVTFRSTKTASGRTSVSPCLPGAASQATPAGR
ncbi:hypothetical protein FHJ31_22800 [Pseudomonas sp. Fig-3]|nr:hypothetical protein FHJ31_22800 [Pseudomonas sp. Fig-3]